MPIDEPFRRLLRGGAAFHVLPDADVGIVVLTNGAPVGAAEAVVTEFMDIAQFGDVTRNSWYEIAHDHFMNFYKASGDLAGNLPPQNPNFRIRSPSMKASTARPISARSRSGRTAII